MKYSGPPYSKDKLWWSLYLAFFSFKIFERASLLLPGPSKEPALSKMDYVSDRDLLQLTLGEVYGVFCIDLCLNGAESRSKFFLPFCSNEILNQWTKVLCVASFPLFICLE